MKGITRYSALIPLLTLWIVASAFSSQTPQDAAKQQGIRTTYVNADGFRYSFSEPVDGDDVASKHWSGGTRRSPSAVRVCGAVGGMKVKANPTGTDSLEFFFSTDAARIDSVHFVFHSLCGFSRLEVGSRSTPGQLIDAQTCTAKWTLICIVNIVAGHRLTFDLNAKVVIDSVQSLSSCGTTCAVRQFSFSLTNVDFSNPEIPDEASLDQNYPNPFNPSTTIHYALPSHSHITLTVFNTLGQIVKELVNGDVDAGYHDVQFDASGLTSGVYFYRMRAGDFVQTKRLLVLK